jgi:hypothetical protein
MVIKPDSITISGPGTLIDTVNSINTISVRLDRLANAYTSSIGLGEIPQVGFSHRRVTLTIPVEKYTEAELSKSLKVINLPDTLRLILLPRTVTLKCNVPISRYKDLFEDDIVMPYVDFRDSYQQSGNKLRIQVETQPYAVRVVDIEPKFVDFIIERI